MWVNTASGVMIQLSYQSINWCLAHNNKHSSSVRLSLNLLFFYYHVWYVHFSFYFTIESEFSGSLCLTCTQSSGWTGSLVDFLISFPFVRLNLWQWMKGEKHVRTAWGKLFFHTDRLLALSGHSQSANRKKINNESKINIVGYQKYSYSTGKMLLSQLQHRKWNCSIQTNKAKAQQKSWGFNLDLKVTGTGTHFTLSGSWFLIPKCAGFY